MFDKESLVISLKLFLITALTALLLAVVNNITTPIIDKNNEAVALASKQEVLPEADRFETTASDVQLENVTLDELNIGLKGDSHCGYVVTLISSEGYGGDIKVMVGIDKDLKVTKVKILEIAETPGLGMNASKPKFIDQFIGTDKPLSVVKGEAKDGEISAISSATVTSKAVTACVNGAIEIATEKSEAGVLEDTVKRAEQIKHETNRQLSEAEKEE